MALLRIILISLVLFPQVLFGQTFGLFGNEWVQDGQSYFKFYISENGIYKLSFDNLEAAGIPLDEINPRYLKIFHNGKEIPIYCDGEADQTFDKQDFVLFYGKYNDGTLDKALYKDTSQQTNPYLSLYNDSSAYFLTWDKSTLGARYLFYHNPNYLGKKADAFFWETKIKNCHSDHFMGVPFNHDLAQSPSEYTAGEGWVDFAWQAQRKYVFDLKNPYKNGPNPIISCAASSTNNNPNAIVNGKNHEFALSVGSISNVIQSSQQYALHFLSFSDLAFDKNLMENTLEVFAGEKSFNNSQHGIHYLTIKYPRQARLEGEDFLEFFTASTNTYYELGNPQNTSSYWVIDHNNQNIVPAGITPNGDLAFNLKNSSKFLSLFDKSKAKTISPTRIKEVAMLDVKDIPKQTNYLIITHKRLKDGAERYAQYRGSIEGGKHKTCILYANEIYDLFYYGCHHPLAIKNCLDFLHKSGSGPSAIEHILLLGKGQSYSEISFRPKARNQLDLVPTIGMPPSDYLFVSDLRGQNLQIDVPIGRIPAKTNDQIDTYLNKIKAYEKPSNEAWRKRVIQFAGGSSNGENTQFQNYLNQYAHTFQDSFFGGFLYRFSKTDPLPVQRSLVESIHAEFDKGAAVIQYFGHASSAVLDIDIGNPNDLSAYGRAGLFMFNGCALGNSFTNSSVCEDWLVNSDFGATGWLASSNYGFVSPLYKHTKILCKKIFLENYGATVGKSIQDALSEYADPSNSFNILQSRQLVYHGDPALRIPSPLKPDFTTAQLSEKTNQNLPDSICFSHRIQNLGMARSYTLPLKIQVTNNKGKIVFVDSFFHKAPFYEQEYALSIPKYDLEGWIEIRLEIDPHNSIEEQGLDGESNNIFVYNYNIPSKKAKILYPAFESIIGKNEFELLVQFPFEKYIEKEIEIQWDTTPHFQSKTIGIAQYHTSKNTVMLPVKLPILDNKDFFIRVRFISAGDTSPWSENHILGLVLGDTPGWTQGSTHQFAKIDQKGILYDTIKKKFSFRKENSRSYGISTEGQNNGRYAHRFIEIEDLSRVIINWWPAEGINLMVINNLTEERYFVKNQFNIPYPSPWWNPGNLGGPYTTIGQPCGVYNYELNEQSDQDSLIEFLEKVPDGYHLIMLNAFRCNPSLWKNELWEAFQKFGISALQNSEDGAPFIIIGTRGGEAIEYLANPNDPLVDPKNQKISINHLFTPNAPTGVIVSKSIGPASSWGDIVIDWQKESIEQTDHYHVEVWGTRNQTEWYFLKEVKDTHYVNLSDISSSDYPFLRFKIRFEDKQKRSPIQPKRWRVHFTGAPEGGFNSDLGIDFRSDTLYEGAKMNCIVHFQNLLKTNYPSASFFAVLQNEKGESDTLIKGQLPELFSDSSAKIQVGKPSLGLDGTYKLYIHVNHNDFEEIDHSNNVYFKKFIVVKDKREPLLDVVIDKQYIQNNDYISPQSTILLKGKDDNLNLPINRPDLFHLTIKFPGQDSFTKIAENVQFLPSNGNNPAEFLYHHGNLPNGNYVLRAQLMDQAGNKSGSNMKELTFNVLDKPKVSKVYFYPNPIINRTSLSFTLTGASLPEIFKIDIYSSEGKWVHTIDLKQSNDLHIGNNQIEYLWDGTDYLGKKLSSGVYLYKVSTKYNFESLELRNDDFFESTYGRLFLMK